VRFLLPYLAVASWWLIAFASSSFDDFITYAVFVLFVIPTLATLVFAVGLPLWDREKWQ
jgi:hypothetical protein